MPVEGENYAAIFLSYNSNIAIKQINILSFLFQLVRETPRFYPAIFFLIDNMKSINPDGCINKDSISAHGA